VRFVETAGTMNSVLNIFYQDSASAGLDWRTGRSVFRTRFDVSRYNAITRQNQYQWNFGAGATGGETFTQGAATGVGTITQSSGQNLNQYRRLLNGRIGHTYTGDQWKFDWTAAYSEARRDNSDIDEGMFSNAAANVPTVIVSGQEVNRMSEMMMPKLSVKSRTGATIDPYDVRAYTLNTASSARLGMKNVLETAAANASRFFNAVLPLALKAGVLVEKTKRDTWTESSSWNFRPPASAGGQIVGNYDLVAEGLAWRPDIETEPRFRELEREVKQRFAEL